MIPVGLDWAIARCNALTEQGFDRIRISALKRDFEAAKSAGVGNIDPSEVQHAFDTLSIRLEAEFDPTHPILERVDELAKEIVKDL